MTAVLVATLFVAIAIGAFRLHPFLALIVGAVLAGSLAPGAGSFPERVLAALDESAADFGQVVGAIGIAIALAAVVGDCLLRSGAADRIAGALLRAFGERRAAWALAAAAWALSIPVFFDTVFFLLIPLARALARRAPGRYPEFVTAICAGAIATHSLVPPTPGPLAMADNLGIELGAAAGFGMLLGLLPVAGLVLLSPLLRRGLSVEPGADATATGRSDSDAGGNGSATRKRPGLLASLLPVALPVLLIAGASAADAGGRFDSGAAAWLPVLGHRNAALCLAAVAAALVLRRSQALPFRRLAASFGGALGAAGPIILITAAGGAFGRALAGSGITDALGGVSANAEGPALLLLAAGIATALKLAQGSGTVAILSGSAIVASVVPDLGALPFHPGYLFAAVGFGSMIGSWMNDSGFWVVGRMSGFTEAQTFRTWTLAAALVGLLGLLQVLLLAALLPLR